MIYLDAAATTFQKPPEVAAAMQEALKTMSSPGRGGYPAAQLAADTAFACRCELAELFRLDNPEQVIFTHNATHGLNIAIKSLVPQGGRVVISGYEHNAVTRPLTVLKAQISVAESPLFQPDAAVEAFEKKLRAGADAVICCHVSNVFGTVLPIDDISTVCRDKGIPFIVDASQSAGTIALDMKKLGAAFVAMPGHKGLYGPQGTGILLCGDEEKTKPLMEGGTGTLSMLQEMPDFLPDRLEAGTHNMPGIAGLLAGVRYVRGRGESEICRGERQLALLAAGLLRELPAVRVFSADGLRNQTGVLSFVLDNLGAEETAAALAQRGIALRAGLHCAPLAHHSAGTLETGTVRISFSDFNTAEEVFRFFSEVKRLIS